MAGTARRRSPLTTANASFLKGIPVRVIGFIALAIASLIALSGCIHGDSKPTPTPTIDDMFVIETQTGGTGSSTNDSEEQTYVVQEGDSLSSIAEKFGVTERSLISANGLANPDDIKVGQVLVIP